MARLFQLQSFTKTTKKYYQGKDRDDLSPAEKYDLLVGDENFTLTQRSCQVGRDIMSLVSHVERWMGLCHGWAPTAYMLPRPKQSLIVPDADGGRLLSTRQISKLSGHYYGLKRRLVLALLVGAVT
ncbi:hypothetical protein OH492_27090 [Vibrio chagasii]|nr:hypothetical protein [Vibrio chagasii]